MAKKDFKIRKKDRIPLELQPLPFYSESYGHRNNDHDKYGRLTEEDAMWIAAERIRNSDKDFTIYIGTDSQTHSDTKIVSVIVVYEHKSGGFSFFTIDWTEKYTVDRLKDKITDETQRSIDLANRTLLYMMENDVDVEVCVHADVGKGKHSKTKDMIQWVVAMIEAEGFRAETKPFHGQHLVWPTVSVSDTHSRYSSCNT